MGETTKTQQQKKIEALVKELGAGEPSKVTAALKSLQTHGDSTILEPLAVLLMATRSEKIREEIQLFLNDLTDSDAKEEMIRILREDAFLPVRQLLLSTVWNSKIDYSEYLPEFVEIAVDGNYMEALECLTIIENLEGPFEEQHILESQLHLRDYIEDKAPKDSQKSIIMSEIALILKDYDNMDEDDLEEFLSE